MHNLISFLDHRPVIKLKIHPMATSFEQPHHMRTLFTEQDQLTASNTSKNNENIGTKLIISRLV